MRGPKLAGEMADGTMFCGGPLNEPKETWDPEALYFKLPAGKKAIGDSAYKHIPEKVITFAKSDEAKKIINRAKARQESYHWRLKTFTFCQLHSAMVSLQREKLNCTKCVPKLWV